MNTGFQMFSLMLQTFSCPSLLLLLHWFLQSAAMC